MSNDNRGGAGHPDPRTLVAENYSLIQHYARRLAPWAAEDVAQDACVLAMHWDNYKPGKPVRNWLYWCVMSARAKHEYARRRSGMLLDDVEMVPANDNHTAPTQEHVAELALIASRIAALPPRQREVMTALATGSNTGEVARALGITGQAAASTARKARAKLAA